jgi:dihydroorotate dehydrogenase electron transfer subunit
MLALASGDCLNLIGPIGRGWNINAGKHALLVGGGVGAAPLYLLAEARSAAGLATTVVLGAATTQMLTCAQDFQTLLGNDLIHLATDDGSIGSAGLVTTPLQELLQTANYDHLATCGPEPMQQAVVKLARQYAISCEVSLERRMACGIGACLSCVAKTANGQNRVCVDGPVFAAEELLW